MYRILLATFFLLGVLSINGCSDKNIIMNKHHNIAEFKWYFTDKIIFTTNIEDTAIKYKTNIYIRHTNNYKYSNLFFLVTTVSPSNNKQTYRCEYPLANKDGLWYGSNTSNLYTVSLPIEQLSHFNEPGTWKFIIEQNMRDDTLLEVTDVGIIIKKDTK
ncbi:MAG: gliding motility lipoprotein GldH [Solitalea-like symbiont of Tyrophagus putrescentiae]